MDAVASVAIAKKHRANSYKTVFIVSRFFFSFFVFVTFVPERYVGSSMVYDSNSSHSPLTAACKD